MGTAQTLIWTTTSGISFLSHPDCDLELYVECKNGHVTFLWRQLRTRSINANANFSKNDYRVVEPNAIVAYFPFIATFQSILPIHPLPPMRRDFYFQNSKINWTLDVSARHPLFFQRKKAHWHLDSHTFSKGASVADAKTSNVSVQVLSWCPCISLFIGYVLAIFMISVSRFVFR